ncbi:WYL domain-containing protein [Flammeovirga yaeyamensis]|uniref:WYL domain-containing protein n=1 Tax=Flammeovirga yaeyamensis TaxID=367791 RepID=A0AAX1ND79_9BACT|nr:WYL domain-containing protein [Flammeovirga yaeyamensis]MBB3698983.1 putative DNA-binding transcriptional regulator YafY [Flammeovirga yaeyamensis]NMF36417.1 WYL domain-containing protein [Flammeovirga yaeyamensis]QWG03623.1 WYL domain-containing protein [Flammeovirga yaeyamensis]
MKSSKLSFLRYLLIDRCIRNKQNPYPSKMYLLDKCRDEFGVNSPSTIEKDLQALRQEFDAPIKYSKKNDGYFYSDPNYKLLGVHHLTEEHLDALNFVETFLYEFKALPVLSNFSDAVDKVLDGLDITKKFNDGQQKQFDNFIQLEKSIYSKGNELFSSLINSTKNHEVIRIHYQKFDVDEVENYDFHPYLIKEFKGLWYITGYAENREGIRTLGIDRIKNIEILSDKTFSYEHHNVNFDREAYFKNCIGVTLKGKPQEIRLLLSPIAANYIKTSKIHDSQEIIREDKDGVEIRLKLVDNNELRSIILSWGNQIEVLSPFSLRKKIGEEIKQLAQKY